MNVPLFMQRLELLLDECEVRLTAPICITPMARPHTESFAPGTQENTFKAVRDRQSIQINFSVNADVATSPWRHESGDNRQLSPSLLQQ